VVFHKKTNQPISETQLFEIRKENNSYYLNSRLQSEQYLWFVIKSFKALVIPICSIWLRKGLKSHWDSSYV